MAEATPMAPRGLRDRLPLGRDAAAVRTRLEALEAVLEGLFVIPGLNRRVGLDVLLNILPFGGTTVGAALGGYMIWEARNLGMSGWQLARMTGNVALDWLFGMIPFIGAVPDLLFRSNSRNLRIVKRHLDRHHPATVTLDR